MFNVEQSPFLYSLGYAIGHSLWQMSVLWLAYTAVISMRRWTSNQRYNLAVTAATAGFLWFAATLVYYGFKISANDLSPAPLVIEDGKHIFQGNSFFFFYHSLMATLRSLAPYFSCAYLFVTLLLSIRLANGFAQVKKLKTTGLGKAPVNWRLFVRDHAALIGINKPVLLHVSSLASTPLTIGFIKPIILLPFASINNLTTQQLEAVLLHELAHIRRNDYLVNILLQVAEISLFFNPFMRLFLKQARIERENCCDDYVLQFRYNAADYARALLSIEQHCTGNMLALGTNNNNQFQLLNRVKRMMAPERRSFNYKQQLGLLFILTLIGLSFTVFSPKPKQEKQETVKETAAVQNHPVTNMYQNILPQAVDLVKNLEGISISDNTDNNTTPVHKTRKQMKFEAAVSNMQASVEKTLEPPARGLELAASQLAALPGNIYKPATNVNLDKQQLLEIANNGWLNELSPVFGDQLRKLVITGMPALVAKQEEAVMAAQALIGKKIATAAEAKKLQQKIEAEKQRAEHFNGLSSIAFDSLQFTFSNPTGAYANDEAVLARSKKQIAIAPFRVWTAARPAVLGSPGTGYVFSSDDNTDEEEGLSAKPHAAGTYRSFTNRSTCNEPSQNKTINVNGRQIADKVKKVWADAQLQLKDEWTEEMQQKVVGELQKELKGVQNIEIKTYVNNKAGESTRSFVIEIESN